MTDKFSLVWRSTEPVLEYKVSGFWKVADAEEWLAAVGAAVAARPAGRWYMIGDSSEAKAQSKEVNVIRSRIADLTQDAGLAVPS